MTTTIITDTLPKVEAKQFDHVESYLSLSMLPFFRNPEDFLYEFLAKDEGVPPQAKCIVTPDPANHCTYFKWQWFEITI